VTPSALRGAFLRAKLILELQCDCTIRFPKSNKCLARSSARYSIDLDESHRASLALIAKSYRITQGEVIEVLLDRVDDDGDHKLGAAMLAKAGKNRLFSEMSMDHALILRGPGRPTNP
jgi:hypothetical protein